MDRRPYRSPLRESQAARTRERLLSATHDLLISEGAEALTLPRLAKSIGVTAPTAYHHFPTVDALLTAFLAEWLRPRLGLSVDRLAELTAAELTTMVQTNYPRYEQHSAILTAVMNSPTWNRIRVASMSDRADRAAQNFGPSDDLDHRELAARLGPVYALAAPQAWRWLRETWGLTDDEAEQAAAWAMHTLLKALSQNGIESS
jgi:AcrR family transcriptional regulator